jgi:hypothetical protein
MGLSHRRMAPCDRQSQKAHARYRAEGQTRNISKSRGSRHRTLLGSAIFHATIMPTGLKNIVSGGPNQADEKPFTPWPAGVATQKSRMLYLVVQWFIVCAREIAKPQHQASGHVAFGSG